MAVIISGDNTPTAGSVIYGNGTTLTPTAVGTAGQALLSGGSGAPTWGSAGATTLIATYTPSNASTVDIAITGSYSSYQIIGTNITASGSSATVLAYYTTNNFSSVSQWQGGIGTIKNSASAGGPTYFDGSQYLCGSANSITYTGGAVAGIMVNVLYSNLTGSNLKLVVGSFGGMMADGSGYNGYAVGNVSQMTTSITTAINGIRFYLGNSRLISGTFKLYGIS